MCGLSAWETVSCCCTTVLDIYEVHFKEALTTSLILMATQAAIMINAMGPKSTDEAQTLNRTWVYQIWAISFLSEFKEAKILRRPFLCHWTVVTCQVHPRKYFLLTHLTLAKQGEDSQFFPSALSFPDLLCRKLKLLLHSGTCDSQEQDMGQSQCREGSFSVVRRDRWL